MDLYEQKYNDALERMKSWANGEHPECFSEAQKAAEFIFPELAENGDEKIRKEIMQLIQCMHDADPRKERWIAWLEKQKKPEDMGEISDGYHTFNELYRYRMLYNAAFVNLLPKELVYKSKRHHDGKECFGGGWFIVMVNLPTGQISNHYELKDWDLFQIPEKDVADEWDGHTPQEAADRLHRYLLERQREQPTDKIEPKFKVRDWIANGGANPCYVKSIFGDYYELCSCEGFEYTKHIIDVNYTYHLWAINDAKDGDVLCYENKDDFRIFIYKGGHIDYHCCYSNGHLTPIDSFVVVPKYLLCYIQPATKEQRDLLFSKMKEAGYEWDIEKKELKKIEPKFKVGDWIVINATTYQITEIDNSHVVLSLNGRECNFRLNVLNLNNAHLWTIADAKDGDILVTEDYIFIFKYILHGGVHLYCHYDIDDEQFDADIPDAVIGNIRDKGIHFRPATKEQRDLLFSKMKEDGYEWDALTKKIKRITKFKIGDKVHCGDENQPVTIIDITNDSYITDSMIGPILFSEEDNWTKIEVKSLDTDKVIDSDVLQELNKLKEEIKELKEEIKNLNNRRRWK